MLEPGPRPVLILLLVAGMTGSHPLIWQQPHGDEAAGGTLHRILS